MRLRDIEFRYSDTNKCHELVKWHAPVDTHFTPTCFVIAFFDKGKEGYNMRTIGDRFFLDKDAWLVGKHAMAFLADVFEGERQ
jgi:hypothetical protein